MPNGNVIKYATSNPEENRLRLVRPEVAPSRSPLLLIDDLQLSEVASGVDYLHELKVVHGDLKGVGPSFFVHP